MSQTDSRIAESSDTHKPSDPGDGSDDDRPLSELGKGFKNSPSKYVRGSLLLRRPERANPSSQNPADVELDELVAREVSEWRNEDSSQVLRQRKNASEHAMDEVFLIYYSFVRLRKLKNFYSPFTLFHIRLSRLLALISFLILRSLPPRVAEAGQSPFLILHYFLSHVLSKLTHHPVSMHPNRRSLAYPKLKMLLQTKLQAPNLQLWLLHHLVLSYLLLQSSKPSHLHHKYLLSSTRSPSLPFSPAKPPQLRLIIAHPSQGTTFPFPLIHYKNHTPFHPFRNPIHKTLTMNTDSSFFLLHRPAQNLLSPWQI